LNIASNFKQLLKNHSYLLATAAMLITISFVIDNYWSDASSAEMVTRNMASYIRQQEDDFDKLAHDSGTINQLLQNRFTEPQLRELTEKKYYLFAYRYTDSNQYQLAFWNSQAVTPDTLLLQQPGITGFSQQSNGYYTWRKHHTRNCLLLCLVPIKWNYAISNEYLENNFAISKNLKNSFAISQQSGNNSIRSKEGQFLFSLQQKFVSGITQNNWLAVVFKLFGMLLILVFIQIAAIYFTQQHFLKGAGFLLAILLLLRFASYWLPIPLNLRQFELFDPAVYASNFVLRSLGDLLINALLCLWYVLFVRHYMFEKRIVLKVQQPWLKWSLVIGLCFTLVLVTLATGNVIRSLVTDSQISFDVVNFFTLNGFSVVGFVVLGTIAIGYFLFTQLAMSIIKQLFTGNTITLLLIISAAGLLALTLRFNSPLVIFELYLLIWLMAYLYLIDIRSLYLFTSRIVTSKFIFWLFFFCISISFIIISANKIKEVEKRKNYAETLSAKADPASERVMNTVLTDFRNEVLYPLFEQFKTETLNKKIKDSLLNENFTGYLNRYDTRIYTFDDKEQPLFNEDSATFSTLNTILRTEGKPTAMPDLYYYDVSYDQFTYLSQKKITDTSNRLLGYLFVMATPKKYKTDALYPELFLKGYNNSIENSPVYSYAVYNNLQLVNSHNDYAFPFHLNTANLPVTAFETRSRQGYNELWYKAAADKVVIIAKKDNLLLEAITLFSYLFCSFLAVTGLFWLLNTVIRSRLRWKNIINYWHLSIRNQVHGTIIFMSLLSFLVVGVATVLFFINRYYNNNRERLSRTIHVMQNELRNSLSSLTIFDDEIKVYDEAYKNKLDEIITHISEVHAADVNLYGLDGQLKASSISLPYSRGILGTQMEPEAYFHMNQRREIQFFKTEQIGGLSYISHYVPVIDERGNEYAYLNIPYFTSQAKLRQEIASFLVAIINLNAFIFLIAGIVALFITNRITRSFSFISNKMKAVNLGKVNEAITWNRKDEIGELVEEYNKMVAKLDDSALALAKSEREGAWREMARQVAHEIKNPLTPMKLSLQYLQRAIDSNTSNVNELSKTVASTLVEQIDHLSQIASEFSQFANIGNPKNEVFDFNDSLQLIINLNSISDTYSINWQPTNKRVWVYADKTQINRLFTNLITNAIQALPENKQGHIQVDQKLNENSVWITVTDNGNGIPTDVQSKIFTPNFTTKTSGTGLGLAMCKSITEQHKGRIWFKTVEGVGTSFYVELPILQSME
jgi:two-component system, NtrC family, nitrogen regulation sensor histidine kinase NtrY